jgi:hypothetical protein
MSDNLLFSIADISERMVKALDGAMGIGYPIIVVKENWTGTY